MKQKKTIIIAIAFVLLIGIYCFAILSINRVPGGTYINGKSCSFMDYGEAAKLLTESVESRKIVIKNGAEVIGEINAEDYAAMSFREETIEAISKQRSAMDKLLFFLYKVEYDMEPEVLVSSEAINNMVKEFGGTTAPINAYIAKEDDSNTFVVVKEENGNMVDSYTAETIITEAIEDNLQEVDISNAFVKAGVLATDERLVNKCEKLNKDFDGLVIKLVYKDGASAKTTVLQDEELMGMYKVDEHGVPYISEEEEYEVDSKLVREYVESVVPEDYEEYVQLSEEENTDKSDKTDKNADKTDVLNEEKPKDTRAEKINELTEWLIESLQKCKSGNKTF